MAKAKGKGVPYWTQKRHALRIILGGYVQMDIADAVYPDDPVEAHRVADNFRKWVHSMPKRRDGPKKFFDDLARHLGCEPYVTGSMLVEADLSIFINLLPEHYRDAARDALKHNTEAEILSAIPERLAAAAGKGKDGKGIYIPRRNGRGSLAFKPMMIRKGMIEPMEKGLDEGLVNQRHYYLTPEAADNWDRLVRADEYPTYDHCKAGLRDLVSHDEWPNAIRQSNIASVVMLTGGGAPTKDMVIINDLLRQQFLAARRIPYFIIDVSFYMLFTSMWWLDDKLGTVSDGSRMEITPVNGDILQLVECEPGTFRSNGHGILFGITGGTIGNLNENDFFESLNSISKKSDLLILSADTIAGTDDEDTRRELIKKYRHRDMQRFVSPAVRAIAGSVYGLNEDTVYKKIKVEARDGASQGLSVVPGSLTIVLTLKHDRRNITLLSSTRYLKENLISFAAQRGWQFLFAVPSPLNSSFVQFLFRRI